MAEPEPEDPRFICGLDATLRVIAGKWKPLILFFLARGPMRYGELRRSVRGVSDKVLIQQLKDLELDGVVSRTDHKEIPPRVDYALTPLGEGLAAVLAPLCEWGEANEALISAAMRRRGAKVAGSGKAAARRQGDRSDGQNAARSSRFACAA